MRMSHLSRRSFLQTFLLLGPTAGSSKMSVRIGVQNTSVPSLMRTDQERFRLRVVSLNVWAVPILSKATPARMTAIVRRLAELNADIVGLQEVWQEEPRERIIAEASMAS